MKLAGFPIITMPKSHVGGRGKSNQPSKTKKTVSSSDSRSESPSMMSSAELSTVGLLAPRRRSINHIPNSAAKSKPSDTSTVQKDLRPNVFEFLDDADDTSDGDSDSEGAVPPIAPYVDAARHSYLPASVSSFGTRTPDRTFSVTSKDSASTDFEPHTPPEGSPATAHRRLAHNHMAGNKIRFNGDYETRVDYQSDYSAPETFYIPSRMTSSRKNRNTSPSPEESAGTLVPTGKRKLQKTTEADNNNTIPSSGYAYLASKLDSSTKDGQKLAPAYRRFEAVNHRIMLHLQDEISQMEEDLRMMDDYDAKNRIAVAEQEGTKPVPASRRMDVEAQSYSSFHARRAELLERLAYKIIQYNDALCSYSKVRQTLPKASTKEVESYRKWMREQAPIARNEAQFLDHDLDLVVLNYSSLHIDNNLLYFIVGVMTAALLLPLLAY